MNSSIIIGYPLDSTTQLTVLYQMEQTGEVQTISCSVEGTHLPLWLQLRKFSISAIKEHGAYTRLFSDVNNGRNMDTSLFIDFVYSSIMKMERLHSN